MSDPRLPRFSCATQLSDEESHAALVCVKTLNITLQGLMHADAPALGLVCATGDTLADAAGYLEHLARQRGPDAHDQAYRALKEMLRILEEYIEAVFKQTEFPTEPSSPPTMPLPPAQIH